MRVGLTRVWATTFAAAGLLLSLAGPAAATVTGGCQATGTSTSGGSIDLTTATEWHMLSTDVAGGTGTAPSPQTAASVGAYALGLSLPIASGNGSGDTVGSVEGVSVATYAVLGRRFVVAGSSDSCSGEVEVILDDVDALFTILGGGGLAVAVLGLLLSLLVGIRGSGCAMLVLGAVLGGLAGIGLGLALEQFGVLDPRAPIGLGIAALGALIGLLFSRLGGAPRPVV